MHVHKYVYSYNNNMLIYNCDINSRLDITSRLINSLVVITAATTTTAAVVVA